MYEGFYWVGVTYLLIGGILGSIAVLGVITHREESRVQFIHGGEKKPLPLVVALPTFFVITVLFWGILIFRLKITRRD